MSFGNHTLTPIAADVRGNSNNFSVGANQSAQYSSIGSYKPTTIVAANAFDLAACSRAGGGTFTPLFTTLTGLILNTTSGSVSATQMITVQGSLSLSFDFTAAGEVTATPEPSTIALVAAGIPTLMVVAYRQRRRRVVA